MDFLIRAEQYCEQFGDELWFKEYYTKHREYHSVQESVWRTLMCLYSAEVANKLEQGVAV